MSGLPGSDTVTVSLWSWPGWSWCRGEPHPSLGAGLTRGSRRQGTSLNSSILECTSCTIEFLRFEGDKPKMFICIY